MRFKARMAARMSRAFDFSPLAIRPAEAWGRLSEGTGFPLRPGGLSGTPPFAAAGGRGVAEEVSPERESNSVGCFRDAFSRAT